MFRSTTVKLTGVYLTIIMVISLFFSLNIYTLATHELDRGFRRQVAVFQQYAPVDFDDPNALYSQRDQAITAAKNHIIAQLVYINILILVAGGGMSYLFARRTLGPIEEAHEAQKRFTADASHELRTPLTAMQTEIEVALRNPKLNKNEAVELLKSNLEELAKLTRLSDGLLRLARLETSPVIQKPTQLPGIIERAIQDNLALAEKKHILLETGQLPKLRVLGDKSSLIELLGILVNNAIKYSPEKSSIILSLKSENKEALITVTDQGTGIAEVDLARIFERFYRADASRTKQQVDGYGLGLPIAKSLAEMHGGYITVSSTVSRGSEFIVHLPLLKTPSKS